MNIASGAKVVLQDDALKSKKAKRELVTWHESDDILNLDQAMIARAVLRRFKRHMKHCDAVHLELYKGGCEAIRQKLDAYHARRK